MPLAFIGSTEILWIVIVGLLLFGGKLPDIAKDVGRMFFKAKRSLDEIRRESGIDDALRDIRRETDEVGRSVRDLEAEARRAAADVPDWRQAVDHRSGPGAHEAIEEGEAELGQAEDGKSDDARAENGESDDSRAENGRASEDGSATPAEKPSPGPPADEAAPAAEDESADPSADSQQPRRPDGNEN